MDDGKMSSDDALILLQRVVQLEDLLAQYRHSQESMRQRLTELELLANKNQATLVAGDSRP
jgi:hypothetical protein